MLYFVPKFIVLCGAISSKVEYFIIRNTRMLEQFALQMLYIEVYS